MSFQLALLLKFPREVFHLGPPLPLSLEQGPRITSALGQVAFYFDDWDAPSPNRVGGPPVTVDAFFAHFVPSTPPPDLERALTTEEHPYAPRCIGGNLSRRSGKRGKLSVVGRGWGGRGRLRMLGRPRMAEARLLELRWDDTWRVCDRLFADPVLGRYLRAVGDCMREAIRDFLTLLKTEFGQYLVPRTLPVTTARNQWILRMERYARSGNISRPAARAPQLCRRRRHQQADRAAPLAGDCRAARGKPPAPAPRGAAGLCQRTMRSGPRQSSTGPDRGGHRAGGRGEGAGHAPAFAPRHRPDGRCSHRTGHPARRPRRGLDPKGTRSARGRGRSGALRPLCGGDTRVQ